MVDTIDRQMRKFFVKSASFRSESRGGIYLIWTDDIEDFYIIKNSLLTYNQICERANTISDILKQLNNKEKTIKALIIDCPIYDKNEMCSYEKECKYSVEIIRQQDPLLPMIFYTPNLTCLISVMEKDPRLIPILKGDTNSLLHALGLKS